MRLKMPLRSKRGTLTLVPNLLIQEFFIHGSSAEATTEMVGSSQILSTFSHSSAAALVMYQRARKLQNLINDPTSFSSLAEAQLEAYVIAINALSLVDAKNAWVVLSVPPESAHEVRVSD
jgi:hypothetical protein